MLEGKKLFCFEFFVSVNFVGREMFDLVLFCFIGCRGLLGAIFSLMEPSRGLT